MTPLLVLAMSLASDPVFVRHDIDGFPAGYQVAVADLNGSGRPDVIALSTEADRVDWYENPTWQRRPIARTAKNIDLAAHDIDGDGQLEIALASGFYFAQSRRGGQIAWLGRAGRLDEPWSAHPIAVDPVVHRIRWGDLDGDGRKELIHAPLFGPGSEATRNPKPAHLWAFRAPANPARDAWETWKIDETLTVLHGLYVADLDGDGRDEILTASFEGIYRFDFEGSTAEGQWRKRELSSGAPPVDAKPGAARGSSEIAVGRFGPDRPFLVAIEPWHGHQLVVYTQRGEAWVRHEIDGTLDQGHALAVADFDGDGADEIVAGWRGGEGGLALYDPADSGVPFRKEVLDRGIAVEGAVAVDINGNGRLDLVVIAGRTNNLAWYENRRPSSRRGN